MSVSKVVINTGNVLNLVEIKQKAGQNVKDELLESLQIAIQEWNKNEQSKEVPTKESNTVWMSRLNDDLVHKMAEEERKNLKIGIKVFIQNDNTEYLQECLENVFKTLNTDMIESIILAFKPVTKSDVPGEALTNGVGLDSSHDNTNGTTDSDKCEDLLPGLKILWSLLEKYVQLGKILQVGVADCDEACFKQLYSWSEVKPSIVQINLSVCCVVPPGLQAFCKDNDIQLLTHSDPPEIITSQSVSNILTKKVSLIDWCVRYQVHIKCRGVLTVKGYITKVQTEV